MGSAVSVQRAPAQARAEQAKSDSDSIDRMFEEDKKRRRLTHNVLMLGSPKSGKSTFLKQFKIHSQGGFSNAELADFRPAVYRHVLDSAQALVTYMREAGLECTGRGNEIHCDQILEYRLDAAPGSLQNLCFPPDIADSIQQLWKDPIMSTIMDGHSNKFDLMDNAEYFFDRVLTIGMSEYLPNDADALHVYQNNTDLTEVELTEGHQSVCIIDMGNQRGEKRKWLHYFEGVRSIMFCIAISTYDQVLLESQSQTQLHESLLLFQSVISSQWFETTSIILFLNKLDVFKKKLQKSPLERHFPEYTGGDDSDKAAEYIKRRVIRTNRAGLCVYRHLTQATDATNNPSMKLLLSTAKDVILQNVIGGMVCI